MSQIKKPTLSDFNKIEDFSNSVLELNKTLSQLNNFVEVVKRTGDVDTLRAFDRDLKTFLYDNINQYKSNLSEDEN